VEEHPEHVEWFWECSLSSLSLPVSVNSAGIQGKINLTAIHGKRVTIQPKDLT
jgi:hypothetical protein